MPYISQEYSARIMDQFAESLGTKLRREDWQELEPGEYRESQRAEYALASQQVNNLLPTVAEIVMAMLSDRREELRRESESVVTAELGLKVAA